MLLQFVTIEIERPASPQALHRAVEQALERQGEPLRWAITKVNPATNRLWIEAVVTISSGERVNKS